MVLIRIGADNSSYYEHKRTTAGDVSSPSRKTTQDNLLLSIRTRHQLLGGLKRAKNVSTSNIRVDALGAPNHSAITLIRLRALVNTQSKPDMETGEQIVVFLSKTRIGKI